ncbi:MAG TPA: OsmC family peroxiredoxin [Candidatus Binatia bacterium]|nr:OsmC family peroxiredoxin [Candidatus Binatia bacterium]
MIRSAIATWSGGPAAGEGYVTTSSGVITNALYSFGSSTGNEPCTSPTEMLAAAVASCMSLMVTREMAKVGLHEKSVTTEAVLTLAEKKEHWEITDLHVTVATSIPESEVEKFEHAARTAKGRCPISHALKVPIRMTTKVEPAMHPAAA